MEKVGDSLSGLQYKLPSITAERKEWFNLATETNWKLKAAEAAMVL